ncbi:MAG: response regulator [Patescibacteria group bacterium]
MKKILIVDDDKLLLENLSGIFAKDGFEVETAENGALASQILSKEKPDFMLIDLLMPVKSGIDLIKEIASLYPDLISKIIVMTNSENVDDMAEVVNSGVNIYINKSNMDLDGVLKMVKEKMGK